MIDRTEIAFIDLNVSDIDTLIAGFRPEVDWVRLDQSEPAPRQIARALDGRNGLAAIHVLAHGEPGEVSFGAGALAFDSIDEHAAELGTIGTALGERGALMLWSCQTGQGERGSAFIEALARASGATVAAATGLIGAAARAGCWELISQPGTIAARPPLTAEGMARYAGFLAATPTWSSIVITASSIGGADNIVNASEEAGGFAINMSGTGTAANGTPNNGDSVPVTLNLTGGGTVSFNAIISNVASISGGNHTFNWSLTGSAAALFAGLTQGLDTVSVTFPSAATSAPANFTYDTVVPTGGTPDLIIASDSGTSFTDNLTNVRAPTFTVALNSSVAVGDKIELLLGGSAVPNHPVIHTIIQGDITAGFVSLIVTSGDLGADGSKLVSAKFTDTAGNTSTTSALPVTLDTSAPSSAPTPPVLAAASDSGASSTDKLTNVATPTFTGTAEANSTVKLFDNGTQVGSVVADGSGNWSITSSVLSQGTHNNITATATDAAGNASGASGGSTVTIDTTALPPGTPDLQAASDTGPSTTDNVTKVTTPTFSGTGVEANSTVTLFDGATKIGSAAADGSGIWSVTSTTLGQGTHNITATQTDLAGNVSAASTALSVTIDTTAPTVSTVTASPATADLGAGKTVTLTFGLSEAVTVVGTPTLSLNTGNNGVATYVSGSGTNTLTFGYTVRAGDNSADLAVNSTSIGGSNASITDTAGNAVDLAGALANPAGTLQIDTLVPAQPSTLVLAPASDGGLKLDNRTNINAPSFSGQAEANSTVTIFSDGIAVGSGLATGTGSYNVATSTLTDGTHSIGAKATDGAGNVSGFSNLINVTIDTAAPLAPSTPDLQAASDTGTSSTDNITNVAKPVFTGTGENGATVTLLDGGVAIGTGTVNGSGTWQITATTALTEGANAITATQTDVAGNVSVASAGLSVALHTTAPLALPDLVAASDSGPSNSDNITNITTPTFSGTTWANSTVTLFDGVTTLGTGITDANGNWTFSSALGEGNHSITARAADGAGFTSGASPALSVTIDTAAPATPTISAIGGSDGVVSGKAGDNTVSGTAEAGATVTVKSGANTLGTATANGAGGWTYALTGPNLTTLGQGGQAVTATATDAAGNTSGATTPFSFSVDTVAPSTPVVIAVGGPDGIVSGQAGDNTVSGTAEAGATVTVRSGANTLGTATADSGGNWTYALSTANLTTLGQGGGKTLTATATDAAGNTSGAATSPSFAVDTVAPSVPVLNAIGGVDGVVSGQTGDNTVSGTAEAGATVTVRSGANTLGTATADSGGNWTYALSTANLTTLGQGGGKTLTATATDAAGNTSGAATSPSFAVDTVAPSVPVLNAIGGVDGVVSGQTGDNTVSGTAEAGATVTVRSGANTLGTATADGFGNWTYALSTANLTTLGQGGGKTLTATATDTAGNTSGAAAPFSFGVDTVAPSVPVLSTVGGVDGVVSAQAGDNTVSGTAEAGATVTVRSGANTLGTATADGFGNWTYALSPANLTTLGQGSQTATTTATDPAGNTSSATAPFGFSVDTVAPSVPVLSTVGGVDGVVSGQAGDNTVSGTAEAGATVTVRSGGNTLGTATADSFGNWTYALSPANLTTLGQGSQTATATATDAAGNTSSATAPFVFSVDTVAPSVPSITSVTDDVSPGTGPLASGVSTNDTNLTVQVSVATTDAVAGDTIQLFNGIGTGSPLGSYTLLPTDITNGVANVQTGVLATPGTYDITARLIDQAGNLSGASSLFTVTEDANAVCFSAGTRILTASGERIVESLIQGDIVLTLSGEQLTTQPVKWIGRRRIDLTAHPHPETVAPIRIRRSAFADNMPHSDLLVSPDHAVFVDGKLICARQLVNGSTIRQEKGRASVEYFHVELDSHAILLAEGLPAESYLDTGNHGFFINSGEPLVLHPDLTDATDYPAREVGSCAPFVSDEASVLPVWQRLAKRAAALGQPAPKLDTTDDPELRIVAKGRMVRPVYSENGRHVFVLPNGATEVRLISRAGSPTDARPWLDDRRCLGVNVERIVLRGADELQEVPVDHPGLAQGWHAVERDGVTLRRWTSGDAVLPLPALAGPIMLEIRANNGGMGYVVEVDATEEVTRKAA